MTGSEFRQLREHCQLSLRVLAQVWRVVHFTTLWRYEHGRLPIPQKLAKLLAFMAGVVRPCPHCKGSGIERR